MEHNIPLITTLAAGFGYVSPLWVGAGITLAGLVAYVVATGVKGGEFAPAQSLVAA